MPGILVTGGAGYVGSHIVRELVEQGASVTVLDDLSKGHRRAVGGARLVVSDFADREVLDTLLGGGEIDVVVHMAALCEVGASMIDPAAYYTCNLSSSLALAEAARRHGVTGVVFSSSAAVYGEPSRVPIAETDALQPTNPYGETKLAFERALGWYHAAYGLRYVALRYFNAAGAHPSGEIGEDHSPESHLVPRLLQAALQPSAPTPIFGDDYPTRDGTCVRDYVHVVDLARAHVLAVDALRRGRIQAESLNLGNGEGFSVREVVDTVGRVAGRTPPTRVVGRRPGDPASLVASAERARERLGWRPEHATLEDIVRTAWNWHRGHPRGFSDDGEVRHG